MPIPAIIAAVLSGTASAFAAAWLAKLLLPGEQRVGNAMLILIGSLAGVITGVVVNLLNLGPEDGINWWSVGIAVAVSMIAIFFISRWKSSKIEALKAPMKTASTPGKAAKPGPKPGLPAPTRGSEPTRVQDTDLTSDDSPKLR